MAQVDVTTAATLIYESRDGTFGAETRLFIRVAEDGQAVELGRDSSVTFGTGIPLPAGETFKDDLKLGQTWYAVAETGIVDVRFDWQGAK